MSYFTPISEEESYNGIQTAINTRSSFMDSYELDKIEYEIAIGSALIGAVSDLFLLTNVTKLSHDCPVDFKPESHISQLRDSGLINRQVADILSRFHRSRFVKYLEETCKVPYDKVRGSGILGLAPNNHRLRTPGHDPILGLFYGTLDIVMGRMHVVDNTGEMFCLKNNHGRVKNPIEAFVIEFLHLLSDIGSSTSLPFPGLVLLAQKTGHSDVKGYTWTQLADCLYLKGFTVDHLIGCTVPMVFSSLSIWVAENVYRFCLNQSGTHSHLEDPSVLKYKFRKMRTISYFVMALSNVGKVVCTNGNVFAANIPLYLATLKGAYSYVKDLRKLDHECHNYVMEQICEEYSKYDDSFMACLKNRQL